MVVAFCVAAIPEAVGGNDRLMEDKYHKIGARRRNLITSKKWVWVV